MDQYRFCDGLWGVTRLHAAHYHIPALRVIVRESSQERLALLLFRP